jgi:hypothetical protein
MHTYVEWRAAGNIQKGRGEEGARHEVVDLGRCQKRCPALGEHIERDGKYVENDGVLIGERETAKECAWGEGTLRQQRQQQ